MTNSFIQRTNSELQMFKGGGGTPILEGGKERFRYCHLFLAFSDPVCSLFMPNLLTPLSVEKITGMSLSHLVLEII